MARMAGNASEMMVIVKAKELCSYIMSVTQKSPKQYRFTYISRMQNLSLDIVENLYRANEVYIGGNDGVAYLRERREYQQRALTDIKLLAYIAQLSFEQKCILAKQFEQTVGRCSSQRIF